MNIQARRENGIKCRSARSIALLFGEASKDGGISLQNLSAMSVEEREVASAIVATSHNVVGLWSGKLARMTSRHCQPVSRADGGGGGTAE